MGWIIKQTINMNKEKLFEITTRYIKSLTGASGETIITNFGRMREFVNGLDEKKFESELITLLDCFTIQHALDVINKQKISLKDCTSNWNAQAIGKGYQLQKEVAYLREQRPHSKEYLDKWRALLELTLNEKDIATQLCLWGLYFKGCKLQVEDIKRLRELLTDAPTPKQ